MGEVFEVCDGQKRRRREANFCGLAIRETVFGACVGGRSISSLLERIANSTYEHTATQSGERKVFLRNS